MKDGYYLSTYLSPTGIYRLVNVPMRHDNNLSLWEKNGSTIRLVQHWELERISGQKMHRTAFLRLEDMRTFIQSLLAPLGVQIADLAAIWGTPGLETTDAYRLVTDSPYIAYHSIAHLYSAILLDTDVFYDGTILGLAMDSAPDRVLSTRSMTKSYAGCVVRQGDMSMFPIESPGKLYWSARKTFRIRSGTLMALATATKATGWCDREQVLESDFTGTHRYDEAIPAFRRILEQVQETLVPDPDFTEAESLVSAVMKEVQSIQVRIAERNIERILDRYSLDPGHTHLALSGGSALNCPMNSALIQKYGFRGLMAPPCVSDCGQSIGIALGAFHKLTNGRRLHFKFPGPYLGRADANLEGALAQHKAFVAGVAPLDAAVAVADIRREPVVWFNGPAEIGPRALGNRSLLADPTSYSAKLRLNELKQRQWWRPVAPVVLEEHVSDWFDDARSSPYMLETFTVRAGRRPRIPAVAHIDYSARIQSVCRPQNADLYDLIAAFYERTGVPMLCNTSLNDAGEPIVDTIPEAFNFCLRKRLRVGYFNGVRVAFCNFEQYPYDGPLPRQHQWFSQVPPPRAAAIREEANPYSLPDLYLYLYLHGTDMPEAHDIRTAEGARVVREIVERRLEEDPELCRITQEKMERARTVSAYGYSSTSSTAV